MAAVRLPAVGLPLRLQQLPVLLLQRRLLRAASLSPPVGDHTLEGVE